MTSASVAVHINRIFFLGLVVFAASSVVADETDEVVDEITVMGVRDLGALRANQNPELIVALKKRLALEKKFELEREKRFGSDDD